MGMTMAEVADKFIDLSTKIKAMEKKISELEEKLDDKVGVLWGEKENG